MIKSHRQLATKQERAIPWPLIAFMQGVVVIILIAFMIRTRLLHRSVAQALIRHTTESRYDSQSFRGLLSAPMGSELLDATQSAGEARDQNERQISKALTTATTIANDLIKSTGHSPSSLRSLSTHLESTRELDGVTKTINTKLESLPQPILIPADATLRKIRYTAGFVGVLQVDLIAKDGEPINGLTVSDLTVTDTDGNEWPHIAIEQVIAPLADHSIAVLIDKSSSMAGERLVKLQAALDVLIANCSSSTRLAIIGFDSKVVPLSVFTNDHRVLNEATKTIVADGATEITKGIDFAIKELSIKPGYRSILLCTDGQDNNLASNMKRIIEECNRLKVSINVLGLNDASLDKTNLANIAKSTHGQFCLADNPLAINEQMQLLIGTYSKPAYRMFVFNPSRRLDRFRLSLIARPNIFIDVVP